MKFKIAIIIILTSLMFACTNGEATSSSSSNEQISNTSSNSIESGVITLPYI